jgi:small GTP-binding protein
MKKKVCMLGAFAAGKTSLVQQFAHGLFSERYLSTVGVRVEKKPLLVDGILVELLVWDLHGEDDFQKVRTSYVRGAAGCLYVVDGTRRETLDVALELRGRVEAAYPELPSMLLFNKRDLDDAWELGDGEQRRASASGMPVRTVSARSGLGVPEAFEGLCRFMLEGS